MAIKDHRMMLSRTFIAALLAVTFSLFGSGAFADSIDIVNAGFETGDPDYGYPASDNPLDRFVPFGWDYLEVVGAVGSKDDVEYGVVDPDGTFYTETLEGDQFAYILLYSGAAGGDPCLDCNQTDGSYPVGLEQTLDDSVLQNTLQANSKYELTVEVGTPQSVSPDYDYTGFGGYRIELLAGGEVLKYEDDSPAHDDNSKAPTDDSEDGTFFEATVTYVTGSSHLLLDEALGIRLIHKSAQNNPGISNWASEIAFDDVRLTVSAVPVPAAVWLFGTALLGLVGFSKRRKTVQPV